MGVFGKIDDGILRAQVRELFCRPSRVPSRAGLPDIGNGYQLLRAIGRGARGDIYLAQRPGRLSNVAVKLLHGFCDSETRQRFRREALCASLVRHPNIVAVYDVIRNRREDAIVMEFVRGKTLDRCIPKDGLPLERCLSYATQIATALVAIHSAHMIHRDLKPRNLVVTKDGVVKLLDFGLAKITNNQKSVGLGDGGPETLDGTILGTVGYMSPEQVLGKAADHRSDIFSFGVIFYEMLTGRRAFHQQNAKATMDAILSGRAPKIPSRTPRDIALIVRRCLSKEPNARYPTSNALLADLEQAT